jgi:hypothetical protein
MTIRRNCIAVCLLFSVALIAASGKARAAPAGDEYVPRVPKAAGNEVVAGQGKDQGPGSTILQPAIRGAREGNQSGKDASAAGDASGGDSAPAGSDSADNSSATLGTLGDPVVMLLLAGVIGLAGAIMLRGRKVADLPPRPTDDEPGGRSGSPSTPDGEIVDDGDEKP